MSTTTWTPTTPQPPFTLAGLGGVASNSSGQYLVAFGNVYLNNSNPYEGSNSVIYTSDYYGINTSSGNTSWNLSSTYSSSVVNWISVASDSTGQNLIAVAQQGSSSIFITSINGGSSWSNIQNFPSGFLVNSVVSDSTGKKLVAVGSYSTSATPYTVYKSSTISNGVVNWTGYTGPPGGHLDIVASDSTVQKLIGVNGHGAQSNIYTSSDGGVSWSQNITSPSSIWGSLASDTTGNYLIACTYNSPYTVYTSVNGGGGPWTEQKQITQNYQNQTWYSVAASSNGSNGIFFVVSNSTIIYSYNSGQTWSAIATQQNFSPDGSPVVMSSNSMGTKIILGSSGNGTVYTYSNVQSGNTLSLPGGRITATQTDSRTLAWTHDSTGTSGTIDMTGPYKLTNTNPSPNNVLTYTLSSSITITSANHYIIIGSEYITIDGGNTTGKRVIFNSVQSYPGLIQNGSINLDTLITTPSYSNITVQNITTYDYNNTSTLVEYGGWVCQPSFGSITDNINYTSNVTVTNCTNNCTITSFGCGGIVGSGFCGSGSSPNTNIIKNCINNGTITGTYSGGIAGTGFCTAGPYLNSFATIQACSNTGNVNSNSSGGIIGAFSSGIISNCTNTGPVIINSIAGGIIGNNNTPGEQCTIENCYTLYGLIAGETTNVSISNNCYVANGTSNNGTSTVAGNGSWSSTAAASFLTLSNGNNTPPTYYWLYNTTATTTISTTPFLIASLYLNNKNYVTSTTQFTTATTSSQTPLQVGLKPLTLAPPATATKSSKSKAKTSTTGTSYATTKKVEASSQNADIGDSVFMVTPDKSSYQVLGSITGFGSIYVSRTLQYTFPTGSMVYIYPAGTSDADIYADQNLPIPIADICFLRNTPIETDQGIISIQKIDPSLHTINNKKIITITKSVTEDKFLICFEKHSLGENIPSARTIVSKYHKIQNRKGKMMDAYKFLDYYEDVKKIDYDGDILYNILMEDHETVNVNNLVCETLHPDHEIAKLYKNNYSDEYTDTVVMFMNYSKKVSTFKKG